MNKHIFSNVRFGFGLSGCLMLLLIGLKVSGLSSLSWFWTIVLPIIVPIIIPIVIGLGFMVIAGIIFVTAFITIFIAEWFKR
jgi:hypothetical protein